MRALLIGFSLCAILPGASWAESECKTADDCAMLGPACCGGACRAIQKKQLKKAKKELDQQCAAASCAAPTKGPSETCSAPIACVQGKCELGHVKAWDADKKSEAQKKETQKSEARKKDAAKPDEAPPK